MFSSSVIASRRIGLGGAGGSLYRGRWPGVYGRLGIGVFAAGWPCV